MTKEEILEATLDLACEKGLGAVSMAMIAERVHLKKSSLYSHFQSKEDLIDSMYAYFREKAKRNRNIGPVDYGALFEGRSFHEILVTAVNQYKRMNTSSDLDRFYRLIMAERIHGPYASAIVLEETSRMIQETRNLFYALSAKKIVRFENPDAAALSFAMGVHAVMEFEHDAENAGSPDAEHAMEEYLREFAAVYGNRRRKS